MGVSREQSSRHNYDNNYVVDNDHIVIDYDDEFYDEFYVKFFDYFIDHDFFHIIDNDNYCIG